MNRLHYIYKYDKLKYGLFIDSSLTATSYSSFYKFKKKRFTRKYLEALLLICLLWPPFFDIVIPDQETSTLDVKGFHMGPLPPFYRIWVINTIHF